MVWKSKPQTSAVSRQSARSGQAMRCIALAAAVAAMAAMSMAAMTVHMMHRAAEAAVDGPAPGLIVRTRCRLVAGAARILRSESHRDGTDRGASHHGQHDPA